MEKITLTDKSAHVVIDGFSYAIGDATRYGIIKEFVFMGKKGVLMRSEKPYGTWPIEPIQQRPHGSK